MIKFRTGVKIKSGVVLIGGDNLQQVATPTITLQRDGITLECTTVGATIRYQYNAVNIPLIPSPPLDVTLSSVEYTAQFGAIQRNNYYVKAKAWKEGMSPSQQTSKVVMFGI